MSDETQILKVLSRGATTAILSLNTFVATAADYPSPTEGGWIARDFRFHTGEAMQELRLHYATVGERTGEPVLILHGTTGSGTGMLTPIFAGELFGPGQTSFYRIPLATGNRQSHRMVYAPSFLHSITMTWSMHNIGW